MKEIILKSIQSFKLKALVMELVSSLNAIWSPSSLNFIHYTVDKNNCLSIDHEKRIARVTNNIAAL